MNRIEFDDLVAHIEATHRGRTPALQNRAFLLALLGYAMVTLAALLAVAALAFGLMVALKVPKLGILLIIWAGVMLFNLARAIWVRTGDPEGVTVTAAEAPRLFALIDEVGRAAGGVRVDRVVLTPEYNAAVQLNPRLGIFGWSRRNLIIGLPLLDSLSSEEFKAVLAHELEHLGRRHGRIGTWIYRTRVTWANIAQSLIASGSTTLFLRPFFGWFWPRFNATAFVLSRHHEYEADAFAAQNTSPAVAGGALVRIKLGARRLDDEFWPSQLRRVRSEEAPPGNLFESMAALLRSEPDPAARDRWLRQSMAVATGTDDTHPELRDRLAAFGAAEGAGCPPLTGATASETYLPNEYAATVRGRFSREWARDVEANWRNNHPKARALAELEAGADSEAEVSEDALWRRCGDSLELEGLAAAQFWTTRLLERNPTHAGAMLLRGQWLAHRDDDACLPLLEDAAKRPEFAEPALGALALFHDRRGDSARVRELRGKADSHDAALEKINAEIAALAQHKTFTEHDYDEGRLAPVRAVLAAQPAIRAARLAKRPLRTAPEHKAYVLVLSLHFPWYKPVSEDTPFRICREVAAALPDNEVTVQVIPEKGNLSAVAKRVGAVPGSLVYERAR